ncbi:hypothetical protein O5W32_002566, partial [Enterococcus faecium]|nr:hypothetical protein [Enterococcus faecium]
PPLLSEQVVYADTLAIVNSMRFIDANNNYIYIGTKGLMGSKDLGVVEKKIDSTSGKTMCPRDSTTWVYCTLSAGNIFYFTPNVDMNFDTTISDSNYKGNKSLIAGTTYAFIVNTDGSISELIEGQGQGQAQVTYNVNTADPADPTANPDFTVLIPTEYQLSNKQKVSAGAVALKDAKDVTQNYTGDKAVKVEVTSAKNFQFDNGGTYKLVDGNKADIPAEITLNKTAVSSVVNAQLTKEGSKAASVDMLTFNYTVQ